MEEEGIILGRTRRNVHKSANEHLLTRRKYFEISKVARDFLIKCNITSLPVRLNDVLRTNNWNIIRYSKVTKDCGIKDIENLMKENWGFVQACPNGKIIIYYDDSEPIHNQRLTVAHEMGHIILEHYKTLPENREQEATMIAVRILMPMCVLHECCVDNAIEVAKMCNVGIDIAKDRFKRYKMLEKRDKYYTDKNEIKLKKLFNNYISKHVVNRNLI